MKHPFDFLKFLFLPLFFLAYHLFLLFYLLQCRGVCALARSSSPSGVLQFDSFGRPIHLSEPGLLWNIPTSSPVGLRGAANPLTPSVPLVDSLEPNLYYGTLQLKDGTILDKPPVMQPPLPTPIQPLPGTPPAPVPTAAPAAEEIPSAQFSPDTIPNAAQSQIPPIAPPPEPLPLLPMQPLAASSIPIFDPSVGVSNKAADLNSLLGSIRSSGLPAADLQSLSLPMLQLRLPWSLKATAAEQAAESTAPIMPMDDACDRDYSLHCPSGWSSAEKEECRAPLDYIGGCPHLLRIDPAATEAKRRFELECHVHWPCKTDRCDQLGGRDYTHECPMGWIYTGECVAPQTYTGHCDSPQNLSGFSVEQKADFSAACRAEWPCRNETCVQDFSHTCPQGWRFDVSNKSCRPPPSYKGVYIDKGEIYKMSADDRFYFSAKWRILWPCAQDTSTINCKQDYGGYACPVSWVDVMGSGVCQAPAGYSPSANCPNKRHFDFLSPDERKDIAEECKLRWPCLGQAPQDCSKCPKQWREVEHKVGWCEPGPSYSGPCHKEQHWVSLSLLQKETIKKMCKVECFMANNWGGETPSGVSAANAARILIQGIAASKHPTLE